MMVEIFDRYGESKSLGGALITREDHCLCLGGNSAEEK